MCFYGLKIGFGDEAPLLLGFGVGGGLKNPDNNVLWSDWMLFID